VRRLLLSWKPRRVHRLRLHGTRIGMTLPPPHTLHRPPGLIGLSIILGLLTWWWAPTIHAQPTTETFWRGSGHTVFVADVGPASILGSYSSHFWFTLRPDGTISGTAMVAYAVSLDDDQLRQVLAIAQAGGNIPLGLVPHVGSLLGGVSEWHDIYGMRVRTKDLCAIRVGSLRGHRIGTRLHLEWEASPPAIAYDILRLRAGGDELQSSSEMPAYSPWLLDGQLSEPFPDEWQATTPAPVEPIEIKGKRFSGWWIAHQTKEKR
jgi:hypothetical protein